MAWCNIQVLCDAVDGNVVLIIHMDEFRSFQPQIQCSVRMFLGGMGVVDMAEGQDHKLPEKKIGRRNPADFLFALFFSDIMNNMFCLKGFLD